MHYWGAILRGWLAQTAGGLPRTFWYLWIGTLINRSGAFVMLYLEINLVVRYDFSATFAGLVLGLFGLGMAAGSLLGGLLSDRWGRRPTLLLSNGAMAATALALGFTYHQLWIAALALVFGLWNGLGRPAFSATLADVLGPRERMRGWNLNYWAINLGFSTAAILAGVLSSGPHLTVFVLNAAASSLMFAMVYWLVPETKPTLAPGSPQGVSQGVSQGGSVRVVLTDRIFMTLVALTFGLWTIIETVKLMPITMHERGMDPSDYGTVVAVNGVMIVLGQLFIPRLVRARNRTYVLATAALLVGAGMGAVAVAASVPILMLTVLVWTAGEMLNAPVAGALVADLSRPEMRGRYQGIAGMGFTLASFVAPVGGGLLLDHTPPVTLWAVLAGLGVAVALGHLLAGPARERRAAELNRREDEARSAPALT